MTIESRSRSPARAKKVVFDIEAHASADEVHELHKSEHHGHAAHALSA